MSSDSDTPLAAGPAFAGLNPASRRTIDEVCDCYEHQLYTRNALAIEDLLGGFREPDRSILLRELLYLELERTLSSDARPSMEKYFQRFPQHTAIVREVFAVWFPPTSQPASPPPTNDALPVIPNYRILRELSEGGMGTVYEAMHTELGNLVAIKVLRPHLVSDLESEVRFKREMKVIGTLSHSHIVQARDAGKAGAMHYLVMEYLVGVDLAQLVQRLGPLPVPDACEIAQRIALALAHAHEHHLVHRDIKPKNVLFGRSYGAAELVQVKVADFGLALLRGYPQRHEAGGVVGTFAFMAPEQYWEQTSDIRSDIYSLGCTLYFLLLGRPPFSRLQYPDTEQLMDAHRRAAVPPLRRLRPDVSEPLEAVILAMLAKSPSDRPQSPADVAEQLAQFTPGYDLNRLLIESSAAKEEAEASSHARGPEPVRDQVAQTQSWQPGTSGAVSPITSQPLASEPIKSFVTEPIAEETSKLSPIEPKPQRSPLVWLAIPIVLVLVVLGVILNLGRSSPKPIDLLKNVDPARDTVAGNWQFKNGVLTSPDAPHARLALPHALPTAYKLEIEARRQQGGRMAIGLVREGRQLPVVLNSAEIDLSPSQENAARTKKLAAKLGFQRGPPNTFTAIVHPEGWLVAFEDRIQLVLLPGEVPDWPLDDWHIPLENTLFVGTHHSVYHFHKITLTTLQP